MKWIPFLFLISFSSFSQDGTWDITNLKFDDPHAIVSFEKLIEDSQSSTKDWSHLQRKEQIQSDWEENLKDQLKERMSGDDVGNGGDFIRSQIRKEMLELADVLHIGIPSLKQILVVSTLGAPYAHTSHQGEFLILFDRDAWADAFQKGLDVRPLLLQILLPGHKDLLSLYQQLEAKKGRPFCVFDFSQEMHIKETKEFESEHEKNPELAKEMALKACREAGWKSCYVSEQKFSGFASLTKHRVTVVGHKFRLKTLSQKERQELACRAALKCEEITFAAPFNQLAPKDFQEITKAVETFCP